MKKTLTILSLIIAMAIQSQNWSPILPNEKMNYQHTDSAYITNTIWVDSVQVFDDNYTLYYLNRIVKDVPGNLEITLRNQPQFLSKNMITEGYGIYTCSSPFNYLFFTLAGLGQTWGFTGSIEAEITNITEEDVFGVQDSIKTISLSDGNEIRLSKNFGILKFPDFENGGYFELLGIQDTEYGEQVIDFWDIFDFEVGDVFQYSENTGNPDGNGNIIRKITITSKSTDNNSYSYDYDGIYHCSYGCWDYYTYTGNFTFIDSLTPLANYFNKQIAVIPYSSSGYGTDRVLAIAKTYKDTESGITYKEYGIKEDETGFEFYKSDLFYEFDFFNDTIYRYEQVSLLGMPCGLKGIGYANSIGETFSFNGCFEYWSDESLMGYVTDGDTVGIITPDSILLLVGNGDIKINNKTYKIYPNPADDWLYVKPQNSGKGIYSIKLRDVFGQLVRGEKEIRSSLYAMDISGLKSGVYFYEIEESSGNIQKGKFIVQ